MSNLSKIFSKDIIIQSIFELSRLLTRRQTGSHIDRPGMGNFIVMIISHNIKNPPTGLFVYCIINNLKYQNVHKFKLTGLYYHHCVLHDT